MPAFWEHLVLQSLPKLVEVGLIYWGQIHQKFECDLWNWFVHLYDSQYAGGGLLGKQGGLWKGWVFFIEGRNRSVIIKDNVKKAQNIRSVKNSILKNHFTPSPTSSIWQIMLQIFKKKVSLEIFLLLKPFLQDAPCQSQCLAWFEMLSCFFSFYPHFEATVWRPGRNVCCNL